MNPIPPIISASWVVYYEIARDFQAVLGGLVAGIFAVCAAIIAYLAAGRPAKATIKNGQDQIQAAERQRAEQQVARKTAFTRAVSFALVRLSDACTMAGTYIIDEMGAIANGLAVLPRPLVTMPPILESEWQDMGTLDDTVQNTVSEIIYIIEAVDEQFASRRLWDGKSIEAMAGRLGDAATAAHVLALELNPSLGKPVGAARAAAKEKRLSGTD